MILTADQRLDCAALGGEAEQHADRGRAAEERRRRQPVHVQGGAGLPALHQRAHRQGPHDQGRPRQGQEAAATTLGRRRRGQQEQRQRELRQGIRFIPQGILLSVK